MARCKHDKQTLGFAVEPFEFDGKTTHEYFTGWQCDACGMVTRRLVEYDDMIFDLPQIDVARWEDAIARAHERMYREMLDATPVGTQHFFAAALS